MAMPHAQPQCTAKPTGLTRPQPIAVNGVGVDRAAIAREMQNHPAGKPIDSWLAAARALVVRELLLQEARRLAIVAAPAQDEDGRRETDEEAQISALIAQQVATPIANDEECRRFYAHNPRRFRSADLYEARHILFAADPRDADARRSARSRAEAATAAIAAAPDRFAALAAEYSACPSGRCGGSLGQISRGQTVAELEAALERMQPSQLSPQPIETRYGYHVVLLERRIEGAYVPFDAVRERIASWLEETVRRTALRQYLGTLAAAAVITGIDLQAGAIPTDR